MRILVVEDDFAIRRIISIYLEPLGKCDIAVNGKEAVEAVSAAYEEKNPYELITLDIMMPEMNGIEALKKIREIERNQGIGIGKGVKVIMTTAVSKLETVINSYKEVCDAYLVKPVDKDKLYETIRSIGLSTDK